MTLDERPEAGRVVEDLQVADLVPDDVVQHTLGRQQQAPVEAHLPAGGARAPARALPADAEALVAGARERRRAIQARCDLGARGTAIETLERRTGIAGGDQQ